MKRGWLAVCMIALSLLLAGAEYLYVTSAADTYVSMLEEADGKMAQSDIYGAESAAKRLQTRFGRQSGMFNIFMYHSEVGDIANDIAMLVRYAQTGCTEEFLATSARAKRELLSVKYSKQLKWDNLF